MSLAVICSHFNPSGFHSPRRNLMRFLRQLKSQKIPVFIAELAYGEDPFFLSREPNHFRFRCDRSQIFWHKENLLNLAAENVPPGFDKIAWIDPDLHFLDPEWYFRAAEALDNCGAVQLFSEAIWTDQDGLSCRVMRSSAYEGQLKVGINHPGFAWAARRGFWSQAGGLCELAIVGGADALFAGACLGGEIPLWLHYPNWESWLKRAVHWIHMNGGCGVIQGQVVHEWHGDDADRSYVMRHLLTKSLKIDQDFRRRPDGLLEFAPNVTLQLRWEFERYFSLRKEDGQATLVENG